MKNELLEWHEEDRVDGGVVITSLVKYTTIKNPIPSAFRRVLNCVDGFSFLVRQTWTRGRPDIKMSFETKPCILAERLLVTGKQWLEPQINAAGETGCRMHYELSVTCSVKGVGGVVARGIEKGTIETYKEQPKRTTQYLALRTRPIDAKPPAEPSPHAAADTAAAMFAA